MFSPTALLGITTSLLPLVLGFSTEIDGHRVETRIHPGNAKDCADLDKKTILEFRGVKADKSFIRLDSGIITACPGNGEDGRDRWLVHQDQTDIVSFRMTFDKKDGQELPEATKCQVYNSKQDTAKDAPIFTLARNSDDFIYPCGTALHGVEVRCGEKKNNRKGVEQDDRNVKICGKSTAW